MRLYSENQFWTELKPLSGHSRAVGCLTPLLYTNMILISKKSIKSHLVHIQISAPRH